MVPSGSLLPALEKFTVNGARPDTGAEFGGYASEVVVRAGETCTEPLSV